MNSILLISFGQHNFSQTMPTNREFHVDQNIQHSMITISLVKLNVFSTSVN